MTHRITLCLLSCILLILPTSTALAVPAAPLLHTLEQGDGSTFSARRWGDEHGSGWETATGYSILFDRTERSWMYATRGKDGTLVSSGHRVGTFIPKGEVGKKLRPDRGTDRTDRFDNGNRTPAPTPTVSGSVTAIPPLAAPAATATTVANLPVILVNFNNTATTYSAVDFNILLFGDRTNSMKDYYSEVSYGAFTVSPGPAGVIGWVTAANSHDYYGENNAGGNDSWPGDLVYEAVQAADTTVDFSRYDQNGDCYVDTVAIVHQGTGEEASPRNTDIWSHSWSLAGANYWGNSHYGIYTTNDICGSDPTQYVKINNYIIQPEKLGNGMTTMGVFAHEFGHTLGLPDLYDTDGTSEGAGNWSLMAGGTWNGVSQGGDRPAHLDPWSRKTLGWIAPVRLGSSAIGKSFAPIETSGELYQLLGSGTQSGDYEYFLLENRQQAGFDAALPSSGLLIWHIDDRIASNRSESYPGCTGCTSHYKVALVQADNLFNLEKNMNGGDNGDPFPGSTARQSFSIASTPDNNLYSGASAGFSLDSILLNGVTITADITFIDTVITATPPGLSASGTASFSFSSPTPAASFQCTLDGSPWSGCNSPAVWTGLVDGSHTFGVRAVDHLGAADSSPATYAWSIDATPPETSITSGPATLATLSSATFGFSSPDATATFNCSLDGAPWSSCTSPASYAALGEGSHAISIRAVDTVGNSDPTPATWNWEVVLTRILKLVTTGQSDSYYPTLAAALAAIPAGTPSTLQLLATTFAETISIDSCGQFLTLQGGYDSGFTTVTGATSVHGPVSLNCGTLIVGNLVIL